jgi:hypothetical protein
MRSRLAVSSCSATSSLCLARLQCVMVCEPIVTVDRRRRIQFVPRHAEFAADRGFVDAMTPAQRRYLAPDIMLARQRTQPVVQPVEGGLFGGRCGGIEALGCAADLDLDQARIGDRPLQRDPPQPPGAFGEIAGGIDGAGRVKLAEYG